VYDHVYTTIETSSEILAMLRDCNTTLQRIEGVLFEGYEQETQINMFLQLNRIGREFVSKLNLFGKDSVANAHGVHMELWSDVVHVDIWGDVLMRMDNEECNYVVTELVRKAVLVSGGSEAGPPSPLAPAFDGKRQHHMAEGPPLTSVGRAPAKTTFAAGDPECHGCILEIEIDPNPSTDAVLPRGSLVKRRCDGK
jgi:hypothetical protein